jgi:hypothetical protein
MLIVNFLARWPKALLQSSTHQQSTVEATEA